MPESLPRIPVMVDSGAYSAWTRGEAIDLKDYIEFIRDLREKLPGLLYINLDVVLNGEASYRNWRRMRRAGLDPIPVYHIGTDEKWLVKYLEQTDFIGLGAIANMNTKKRILSLDRIWGDFLVGEDGMPTVKVHGLGLTSFSLMIRYPWYSIDSTSVMQAGMYGKLYIPHWRKGKWDYTIPPFQMDVSVRSPRAKERGKHIDNLTPKKREILDRYLKDKGFQYGESEIVDGKVKALVKGVSNCYYERMHLNIEFYAHFAQSIPWPRPFRVQRPKGLFV